MAVGYLHEHLTGAEPVDALLGATDIQAVHLAEAAYRLGLDPSEALPITGYDHSLDRHAKPEALAGWTPAATIDKRNDRIGEAMVGVLERRIDAASAGDAPTDPIVEAVAHELVVGGFLSDSHSLS